MSVARECAHVRKGQRANRRVSSSSSWWWFQVRDSALGASDINAGGAFKCCRCEPRGRRATCLSFSRWISRDDAAECIDEHEHLPNTKGEGVEILSCGELENFANRHRGNRARVLSRERSVHLFFLSLSRDTYIYIS